MTLRILEKGTHPSPIVQAMLDYVGPAKKVREKCDDYPTPMGWAVPCASAALGLIGYDPQHIIEPSAGCGTFIKACQVVMPTGVTYHANEYQPKYASALEEVADYVTIGDWVTRAEEEAECRGDVEDPVLIIGNPPFTLAEEHIRAGMVVLRDGEFQAQLLRLNFLEGKSRAENFYPTAGLRYVVPFDGRPRFRPNRHGKMGTDATAYALFLFQKGYKGPASIPETRITEDTAWRA